MASLKGFMSATLGDLASVLGQLKAITGKSAPFTSPDTTLAAAKAHQDAAIAAATVHGIAGWGGVPAALGAAAPGTSTAVPRADHVHPMPSASDTGAVPASGGTFTGPVVVQGTIVPSGYACRGGAGAPAWANQFNIQWADNAATLWIDTSQIGELLRTGKAAVGTPELISNAATRITSESAGTTTLSAKDPTEYTVISHAVTVATACDALWLVDLDWEHDRSQGVQAFYLIATLGQTVGGVSSTLREVWLQRMDGIPSQVVLPERTLVGATATTVGATTYYGTTTIPSTTHTIDWGALKLMGVATLQVPVALASGARTLWVKVKRGGTHSSAGKINSARSSLIELKR